MRHQKPRWAKGGEPVNLAAAAQDALEWLVLFHQRGLTRHRPEEDARLARCILALQQFLPEPTETVEGVE